MWWHRIVYEGFHAVFGQIVAEVVASGGLHHVLMPYAIVVGLEKGFFNQRVVYLGIVYGGQTSAVGVDLGGMR